MTEAGALRRLETLCARSEHSEGELLDKMRRWGLSDEEQARIMEKLVKTRFVDDERFTEAFIHDKIVFNGWGRRKIEQGLCKTRGRGGLYTLARRGGRIALPGCFAPTGAAKVSQRKG